MLKFQKEEEDRLLKEQLFNKAQEGRQEKQQEQIDEKKDEVLNQFEKDMEDRK